MEHVGIDKILKYSEDLLDSGEKKDVEMHIATCNRCHAVFTGLKSMELHMKNSFKDVNPSPDCPEEWEIGALVKKELSPGTAEGISDHIRGCGACLDRAAVLYNFAGLEEAPFETPEEWKGAAVLAVSGQQAEDRLKKKKSSGKGLFQRIFSFLPDVASPVPAFAGIAAFLLVITAATWIFIHSRPDCIPVAMNEKIVIRDSEIPSSFGFTGAGETREVENMQVHIKGEKVIFRWKPVENAGTYEFRLKQDGDTKFSEVIRDNEVSLIKQLVEFRKRYDWVIVGRTPDDRYFEYSGEVVFVKFKTSF